MDYKKLGLIFSSIILPIVLFVVSPLWGSLFTDKKELSYKTLSKRDISTSSSLSEQWPDIQISYLGKDVSKGSFLTIVIVNTGKIPIKSEDFERPITIHLSNSASVISSKVALRVCSGCREKCSSAIKAGFSLGNDRKFSPDSGSLPTAATLLQSRWEHTSAIALA